MTEKFILYLERNTLAKDLIDKSHSWLIEHIKNNQHILPIRATGKLSNDILARENRAKLYRLDHLDSSVVYSDNELATWLYINYQKSDFFETSFQNYIIEKTAPVADSRAKNESDGNFKLQSVPRPWLNIRHSHIFDAGLYTNKLLQDSSRDEIVSKFLRLVHPVNHFLFPTGGIVLAEQNSDPRYQFVAALYMKRKNPKAFEEFYNLIKPNDYFKWTSDWEIIATENYESLDMPLKDNIKDSINISKVNIDLTRNDINEIILSTKTRLQFKKNEIDHLPLSSIILFKINNSGGNATDPRDINITVRISIAEVFKRFDRDKSKDYKKGSHSWPKLPKWAEEYIVDGKIR